MYWHLPRQRLTHAFELRRDFRVQVPDQEPDGQGQDVIAAEGTPVVTPVAGFVYWRA